MLGLTGWKLIIVHGDTKGNYAIYDAYYNAHVVTITFADKISNNRFSNKKEIDKCAYHELFHVKIYELEFVIRERYNNLEEAKEHDIINSVERIIFGKQKYE